MEHDTKTDLCMSNWETTLELLPKDRINSKGKRWRYLPLMDAYTSEVAPFKECLLHKTLTKATFLFLIILIWQSII